MRATSIQIVQTPPLVLRREDAATMMGVSVSLFEAEVRRGNYPQPRKLSKGASGWLYTELLACAHALPVSDLAPGPGQRSKGQGEQVAGCAAGLRD